MRRKRSSRGDGEQLREEIIDAAIGLILESQDVRAPSIREVARKIGVTPPSIYLHFADKNELLDAVAAKYFRQLGDVMAEAARGALTPLQRLHEQGMAYVRFGIANPLMYRVATGGPPGGRSYLDATLADGGFRHLRDTVEQLMDEKFFPPGDPVVVALQLWSVVHGVVSLAVMKPQLPWGDIEIFAEEVLHAACVGRSMIGLELAEKLLPPQK